MVYSQIKGGMTMWTLFSPNKMITGWDINVIEIEIQKEP